MVDDAPMLWSFQLEFAVSYGREATRDGDKGSKVKVRDGKE